MSISVGELYATLKLDKDAFEKNLHSSGISLGSFAKLALGAGAVIGGALIGIGGEAVKAADDLERANDRTGRILGKSAGAFETWAAKNELHLRATQADLEQFGSTADQAFQGMGLSANKSLTMTEGLLQRSADISHLTGRSFEDVFTALLKGSEGATRGMKGLGVVVDQNQVKQEALRLHLWSGKGALDASAKAAATYSLIMRETASSQGAAAARTDSLAEQTKMLPILWNRILITASSVFVPIATAILPAVTSAFAALGDWLAANMPEIQAIVDNVGSSLGGVFSALGSGIGTVLGIIGPPIKEIVGLFTDASDGSNAIADDLSEMALAGDPLAAVISSISGVFSAFTTDVLPTVQTYLSSIATNILPALGNAFSVIATGVLPVIQDALTTFTTTVLPALAGWFDFLATTVIPSVGNAINWVAANILPPLMTAFQVIAETIIPILAEAFATVTKVIEDNWPTISSIAETVGQAVKTAVEGIAVVVKAVAPIIKWLAATIFPILGAAAGVLLHVIDGAFKAIGVVWNAAWDVAKLYAKGIGDAFNNLVGVFNAVGSAISGVFRGAMNFLIGIVNGIIGAVDSIQVHIGRIGLDTPAGFVGVGPFDWNGLGIPRLAYLATGGIVRSPTLAMLGENARPEAVVPLDSPEGRSLFGGGAPSEVHYHLTVQGNPDVSDRGSILRTLQRMTVVGPTSVMPSLRGSDE